MELCSALLYLLADLLLFFIAYKCIFMLLKIPYVSDLDSRYILVTGCDTGFGNGIAKKLDAMGCNVIAACLTEKAEVELKKYSTHKLKTVHMDVSNHDSVSKAFDQVKNMLPANQGGLMCVCVCVCVCV